MNRRDFIGAVGAVAGVGAGRLSVSVGGAEQLSIGDGQPLVDIGAALNDAIQALPEDGGRIRIKQSETGEPHRLLSTVIVDKWNITISGPGRNVPLIAIDDDVLGLEQRAPWVDLQDLSFTTTKDARTLHEHDGLHLGGTSNAQNVRSSFMGRNGISYTDRYSGNTFRAQGLLTRHNGQNLSSEGYEGNGIVMADPSDLGYGAATGGGLNASKFRGGHYDDNAGHGVYLNYYNHHGIDALTAEHNGKWGFWVNADDHYLSAWVGGNAEGSLYFTEHADHNRYHMSGAFNVVDDGENNRPI